MSPQAQAVEIPKRWPLVVQPENRDETVDKDSRLVNCYAEKHSDGYIVEKRPGLSPPIFSLGSLAVGFDGHGIYLWEQNLPGGNFQFLYAVCGQAVYRFTVSTGILTQIGTIGTLYGPTSITVGLTTTIFLYGNTNQFCPIPATVPYLVFGNGNNTFYVGGPPGTGVVTPITGLPNFPGRTVPGFAYLDGTLYVMDNQGAIHGSKNEDDPTVWDTLNVIVAQNEADGGVVLTKQLVYVVAIKQWTTQFFYDAGNPTGSPLSPVPGAMLNYGCVSADTLQSIDDVLFWGATNREGTPQIIMLNNLQHQIISTPAIDRLLTKAVSLGLNASYYSFSFKRAGHRFYGLTLVSASVTLVYDIDQKLWYQWTDANGNYWSIVSQTPDWNGNLLSQHKADGHLHFVDGDYIYPNDDGVLFPVDIYTPNFDAGVDRRKQLNMMRFNADQTAGSELLVRSSNDDYQTWTNFRKVDLGNRRPTLANCGSFYRRAYHFRHFANTSLRVKSVDLQMDIGTL